MSTAASADVGSSTQTSSMLYNSALEKCVQFKQHQQDLLFFLYSLTCLVQAAEVSRYQKGKTNLDFTEETSEWQWHQLGSAPHHSIFYRPMLLLPPNHLHKALKTMDFINKKITEMPFLSPNQQCRSTEGLTY